MARRDATACWASVSVFRISVPQAEPKGPSTWTTRSDEITSRTMLSISNAIGARTKTAYLTDQHRALNQ
jgi:hypothetical protein